MAKKSPQRSIVPCEEHVAIKSGVNNVTARIERWIPENELYPWLPLNLCATNSLFEHRGRSDACNNCKPRQLNGFIRLRIKRLSAIGDCQRNT
jgi:hypothetical protein